MNGFYTEPFYYHRRARGKDRDVGYSWLKNLYCDRNERERYGNALFCRNRDNPRQPFHCHHCRTEYAMELQHHSLWSTTRCPGSLAKWLRKWSVTITWLPWILSSWWWVIKSKLNRRDTVNLDILRPDSIITTDLNSTVFCGVLSVFSDKNKTAVFESRRMLTKKRQDLADQANKLRGGLSKIDDTRVKVKEMAAELEVTQQQVHKSTRECEEFLVTIGTRRTRQWYIISGVYQINL